MSKKKIEGTIPTRLMKVIFRVGKRYFRFRNDPVRSHTNAKFVVDTKVPGRRSSYQ